jgi:hypothetical protein
VRTALTTAAKTRALRLEAEKSMTSHDATWAQVPDCDSGAVGQYYCSTCKLQLTIEYQRHYEESLTGWHWQIQDSDGHVVDSAGNKYATKYESGIGLLDEVREEGLRRFDSVPCRRSN